MRNKPANLKQVAPLFALLISLFISSNGWSDTQNNAISKKLQIEDNVLLLNGSGIRSKFFFDLYVAGLYLEKTSSDANRILSEDTPIAIRMFVLSDLITSDKLIKGTREGFNKSTQNKPEAFQNEIDSLLSAFQDAIKPDDIFDIAYLPNKGVKVFKNGLMIKEISSGSNFRNVLFGIWLGKDPAQESLKEALLNL